MLTVKDVMTTDLVTLKDTDAVSRARQIMGTKNVRHLPILNGAGELVGVLTQRDVLAATVSVLADVNQQVIDDMESSIPIREIMTTAMTVVHKDTLLCEAAKHLLELKIGCLPVLSNGQLVGILTEADFIKIAIELITKFDS